MKRSARLMTLLRLAGAVEQRTRLGLAQASQELTRRERQGRQLEAYEQEYAATWLGRGREGLSGAELSRLAAFRESLARTITAQQASVRSARGQVAREAAAWSRERNRMEVFDDLVDRARAEERRAEERREQRALDEQGGGGRYSGE